jgi:hypothetical protein
MFVLDTYDEIKETALKQFWSGVVIEFLHGLLKRYCSLSVYIYVYPYMYVSKEGMYCM